MLCLFPGIPFPSCKHTQGSYIIQVATGRYHTVAITRHGHVYTWGLNDWGQLGREGVGATGEDDPTPCTNGGSCHDGQPRRVMQLEGELREGGGGGQGQQGRNRKAIREGEEGEGKRAILGLTPCNNGGSCHDGQPRAE